MYVVFFFPAICTIKRGARGRKSLCARFCYGLYVKHGIQHYKQDLIQKVITFVSRSGENYACFF